MSETTIQLTEENASRLYDAFVHFMHAQFGGPKQQRTPTTDSAHRIASHMQEKDDAQLCNELCREYLSNVKTEQPTMAKTDIEKTQDTDAMTMLNELAARLKILSDFAKTAPGRLPSNVQSALWPNA